jgi:hypothetical protein
MGSDVLRLRQTVIANPTADQLDSTSAETLLAEDHSMRIKLVCIVKVSLLLCLTDGARVHAIEPAKPLLVAKPDAFEALIHPNCSHCLVEADRRKGELRDDDRVLCWVQVQTDNYVNDGVVPFRFFLNAYPILSDSWGIFVHDPDAGFARGFSPDEGNFRFHGWRNGVMAMKSDKDGTLYSCLTGIAFDGPRKGHRLEPRPTLVTDWGFWREHYPQSVTYFMYDKFKPVELPAKVNEDSRKSRRAVDGRLPADTMVLGVWDGKKARAYPLDVLQKAGVIHETVDGVPRIVLWYGPTRTAVAYHQPWGTSGLEGDAGWIFKVDDKARDAPFTNQRTGLHWDITGRAIEGGPRLLWMDSVQVKWFAWAAEYPDTSIYGQEVAKRDFKPIDNANVATAPPHGNLDIPSRHFAVVEEVHLGRQKVTLLMDGDTEPKLWSLRPDAEVWRDGWWGRLDQFNKGERVWIWFDTDDSKRPVTISLMADEISQQAFYATGKGNAVESAGSAETTANADLASRRNAQQTLLGKRWVEEGLPGTLIFAYPQRHEVEIMLDHEASQWGRSLNAGDKVTLDVADGITAVVREVRPWRERTQVLLAAGRADLPPLTTGERVKLRLGSPPMTAEEALPPGLDKSLNHAERLEWLMTSIYCTCEMHDGCAGHFFTLAACNATHEKPCGLAKQTREELAAMIDKGATDSEIVATLLTKRGPTLLHPHMLP